MINVNDPRILDRPRSSRARKVTVEKLLRMSLKQAAKEYLENTSLDGVKKFGNPNISSSKRLFWLIVFSAASVVVCYYLFCIWSGTLKSPLIVTTDSWSYHISNVDFPAIAICSANRISREALIGFTKDKYSALSHHNESLEEMLKITNQWGRLIDFSLDASLKKNYVYQNLVNMYREQRSRILETMKSLAPNCNDILIKCAWQGVVVDCKSIFRMRRTSVGHCCTFNYIINFDANGRPQKSPVEVKRQAVPGYRFGLTVILDPMIDDYSYPMIPMLGFDVLIFSPHHFPDLRAGRMMVRKIEPNLAVYLEVTTLKQIATKEVRKYSPITRRCLFSNDLNSSFSDMYSYSSCILACRIKVILSLCKCIPYFYVNENLAQINVCTFEDVRCLNKYKEKLYYIFPSDTADYTGLEVELQESIYCPDCLPDCEATNHYTKGFVTPLSTPDYPEKDFQSKFKNGINLTGKSILYVYHNVAESSLERLDIVNYWYEILSNIGGFAGMLMGFSIASVVEIFYFFFIRFYHILFLNYKRRHTNNQELANNQNVGNL